jgi:hypothetical protein
MLLVGQKNNSTKIAQSICLLSVVRFPRPNGKVARILFEDKSRYSFVTPRSTIMLDTVLLCHVKRRSSAWWGCILSKGLNEPTQICQSGQACW